MDRRVRLLEETFDFIESTENSSIVQRCFQLLADEEVLPEYNLIHDFLNEEFFQRVADIMIEHRNDPLVQISAIKFVDTCQAIEPDGDLAWNVIEESTFPEAVYEAIRGCPNDAVLQANGLEMLRSFGPNTLLRDDWLPPTLVTNAMKNHPLDPEVQSAACQLLDNIMGCIDPFFEEDYAKLDTLSDREYIDAALTAIKNHPNNDVFDAWRSSFSQTFRNIPKKEILLFTQT